MEAVLIKLNIMEWLKKYGMYGVAYAIMYILLTMQMNYSISAMVSGMKTCIKDCDVDSSIKLELLSCVEDKMTNVKVPLFDLLRSESIVIETNQ